jgi:hypothetical protein
MNYAIADDKDLQLELAADAQIEYAETYAPAPVCGQCKFFESGRGQIEGVCRAKKEPWHMDRTVTVLAARRSDDDACPDVWIDVEF